MKKLLVVFTALVLCLSVLAGCGKKEEKETTTEAPTEAETTEPDVVEVELLKGTHHVKIEVKDYGTIEAELYADIAPLTVTNFIDLANSGFYDGLTFHRIMSGFMIQGGDPTGTGRGGSDYCITGEFSANGFVNTLSHERGVLSMARATDYNSASSQFFIMHVDYPALDGQYAAFGKVTSGMEVVDAICEATPVQDDNGTVLPEDQPTITKITVID